MCSVLCLQHMGSVSKKKKKTVSAAWSVARIFAGTQFVCQRGCIYIYTYSLYLWTRCVRRLIYTKHITSHSQDTITLCTISRPISLFFLEIHFFFSFFWRDTFWYVYHAHLRNISFVHHLKTFFLFFSLFPRKSFWFVHHSPSQDSFVIWCDVRQE